MCTHVPRKRLQLHPVSRHEFSHLDARTHAKTNKQTNTRFDQSVTRKRRRTHAAGSFAWIHNPDARKRHSHNCKTLVFVQGRSLFAPLLLSLSAQLSVACWADFPPSFIIVAMCCTVHAFTFRLPWHIWVISELRLHLSSCSFSMPSTHTFSNNELHYWNAEWGKCHAAKLALDLCDHLVCSMKSCNDAMRCSLHHNPKSASCSSLHWF